MKLSHLAFAATLLAILSCSHVALNTASPTSRTQHVYFGTFHIHSTMSDGYISPELMLEDSSSKGKFDFISWVEHRSRLRTSDAKLWQSMLEKAQRENFVVLAGQELYEEKSNQITVQNISELLPQADHFDFCQMYHYLNRLRREHPEKLIWVELQHPISPKDYGHATCLKDKDAFIKALEPIASLIDIAGMRYSFPRDLSEPPQPAFQHHEVTHVEPWYQYLLMGFHLGPKVDGDYHTFFPGQRFSVRTAVWVNGSLTRENLAAAAMNRHTYVTEDMNLKVYTTVNGTHLPGDRLEESNHIRFDLKFEDLDEPNANYELEVLHGVVGGKKISPLAKNEYQITKSGPQFAIDVLNAPHGFFILHIQQKSKDPLSGSEHDDVWLSPVWNEGSKK